VEAVGGLGGFAVADVVGEDEEVFLDVEGLAGVEGLTLMPPRDVLWLYDLRASRREELIRHLAAAGIETRVFFKPMSQQPMYRDAVWSGLNAARFSDDGFYLPTYTDMTADDQDYIIGQVRGFYEG